MARSEDYGFTQLFDDVVERYRLVGASVFGIVWRYSHRRDLFCYASQKTLATKLGVSKKTIQRWLDRLCADGMIVKVRDATQVETAGYRAVYVPEIKRGMDLESRPYGQKVHRGMDLESNQETW